MEVGPLYDWSCCVGKSVVVYALPILAVMLNIANLFLELVTLSSRISLYQIKP